MPNGQLGHRQGRVRASVDWLSFSVRASLPVVRVLLQRFGVSELVMTGHGWSWYHHLALGPNGVRVAWGRDDDPNLVHVDFPGTHCQTIGAESMRKLFLHIRHQLGVVSRLDVTLDDVDRITSIPEAHVQLKRGNAATHAKKIQLIVNEEVGGGDDVTGMGFYLGSRKSDSFLRVYDKYLERLAAQRKQKVAGHVPVDEGVRWELEMRDERATAAVFMLADVKVGAWPAALAGIVCSHVDFRDRQSNARIDRAQRLAWWDRFLLSAKKGKLRIAKRSMSMARTSAWLHNSCAPGLVTLYLYWAEQGMDAEERLREFLAHGLEKMKAKHHALLLNPGS